MIEVSTYVIDIDAPPPPSKKKETNQNLVYMGLSHLYLLM